ncbi:cytochrome P450 [Amycolatopsis regifaucium]|uniref:Cytochrome n=2 Tax=Amycolatopsis regifaucium TaxID=546365 RepID=A0A154M711_9PSEU|nr:cytochrome P450 [Amycolatopsis regifaucium]KZB80200.1 cytochrome [Amycolatopsis regifaucium]OKA09428.1 cytochrome [Amycolatopsis regifaucium]SFH60946.1 oxidation protein CepF [Amycolatopsis regifaucium]
MSEDDPRPLHIRRDGLDPADELLAAGSLTRVTVGSGADAETHWMAATHAVVRQVMGDHKQFSTRRRWDPRDEIGGKGIFRPRELVGNLMDYDPPEHTRLRQKLTPGFTLRKMQRMQPYVEQIVHGCLDEMAEAGSPADLVPLLAEKVPGAVLCELIGVPRDDRDMFLKLCHGHLDASLSQKRRAALGDKFSRYLLAMIARERKEPGDGMIGAVVAEYGDDATDEELRGFCVQVMLAGDDNISGMIGLGVLAMLRHPEQIAAFRGDDQSAQRAVDELIRYLTVPYSPTPRIATQDVTIGGQVIKRGESVICSLPAANRDPALVPDPERLDVTRDPVPHVAFGHGIHHCLGAALARLELRTVFTALWRRFPTLRLADPAQDTKFRLTTPAYGVSELMVAW